MTKEAPTDTRSLEIGQMPTTRYLKDIVSGEFTLQRIGMEAYNADGELREFVLWTNFQFGDLSAQANREKAAAIIAKLKTERKVNAAIGPAVVEANHVTKELTTISDPLFGVYIDATQQDVFTFTMKIREMLKNMGLSEDAFESESREIDPAEFQKELQKALAVLPRPPAITNRQSTA